MKGILKGIGFFLLYFILTMIFQSLSSIGFMSIAAAKGCNDEQQIVEFANKNLLGTTIISGILAVGVQHISKFGTAESEVLAPSTTSWTVTNTEAMTKYDYLLKEGKLSEFANANVDELSEQYVTIISVVEN